MAIWERTEDEELNALERRVAALERALKTDEPSAYRVIQADGVPMPQRSTINFIGGTVTDEAANARTNVE